MTGEAVRRCTNAPRPPPCNVVDHRDEQLIQSHILPTILHKRPIYLQMAVMIGRDTCKYKPGAEQPIASGGHSGPALAEWWSASQSLAHVGLLVTVGYDTRTA